MRKVHLFCNTGGHDKVYDIEIVPANNEDGYLVNFSYGRRGNTPQTGTKTHNPVSLDKANEITDRLISEKKSKGYRESYSGNESTEARRFVETIRDSIGNETTEAVRAEPVRQTSGILPQLLNPIDESEVGRYIQNDNWCAQEKLDGKNKMLRKLASGAINTVNKKGLIVGTPALWLGDAATIHPAFTVAGEDVAEKLYVHDLLGLGATNWRTMGYKDRYIRLKAFMWENKPENLKLVYTAWTTSEKQSLYEKLKSERREGIVFKRIDAPFAEGRPNSAGDMLKAKFYATVSAIVGRINARRSVRLQLKMNGGLVDIGNCTIPPNKEFPPLNSVCEVRYLYAFPESNILYQPVYLGPRDDVDADECTFERQQLKYKPAHEE